MKPHRFLFSAFATAFVNASALFAAPIAESPNILLLFLDNVGYGDLACYGNKAVQTPNVDRLSHEGVRCTNFYTAAPSCSPSRGALLTGRHPERNGLNYQLSPEENMGGEGLPRSEQIIPQYLKPLGYATGVFGKWNLGFAPGYRPTDRGFDEFLGHMSGNIHYYKHLYRGQNDMRRGTEPIDLAGQYSTDVFAVAAIDFIRRNQARPWFVYLPFNAVHFVSGANTEADEQAQWQVPGRYLKRYGLPPDEPDEKKRFRAVLTALDDAIGRVVSAVDGAGLRERTLILCISDNGAFMLKGRGLEVQSNLPLRGGGVTTQEGGIRVPAVIRWPSRLPAGTVCSEMLSTLDVLPLSLLAAGGALPGNAVVDGRDPLQALMGKAPSPHEALYWYWDQGRKEQWRSMRAGNWKITRRADQEPWQLYDLSQDVGETQDLAGGHADLVKALSGKFEGWHRSVMNDSSRSISLRGQRK